MPFIVFSIGSALIVLGFTLKVLEVTNRLTELKKGAEKKLQIIGIVSVVAGILIALVVVGMPPDERNALTVAGLNIVAVGISTLIQYYLKPKNEKVLSWGSIIVIILGIGLCYAYQLLH